MDIHQIAHGFSECFRGNENAYGVHQYGTIVPGEKEVGGTNATKKNRLAASQYADHLAGKEGLGIIPINKDNQVHFCALDIDIYGPELSKLSTALVAIEYHNFPIGVFKTKSGGYHLYIFFDGPVDAKDGLAVLRKYVNVLGIKKIAGSAQERPLEYFPKQETLSEKGIGNWLNLPYYDMGSLGQKMVYDGREIDVVTALNRIKSSLRKKLEDHHKFIDSIELYDAPPCLQTIQLLRSQTDMRNTFLFSMGVYYLKKDEDAFEQNMYEANRKLPKPMEIKEIDNTVIKSLRANEYSYKCKESPCLDFCDKRECAKREFGIGEGKEVSNLSFGQMTHFRQGIAGYYTWLIDGKEVTFEDEDEIINQGTFAKRIFRELHIVPMQLKTNVWRKTVNKSLMHIEVKSVGADTMDGKGSEVYDAVGKFFEYRSSAKTKEVLVDNLAWNDSNNSRFIFLAKTLQKYLFSQGIQKNDLPGVFKNFLETLSAEPGIRLGIKRTNGKYRTLYCYAIPYDKVEMYMDTHPEDLTDDVQIKKLMQQKEEERRTDFNDNENMY